jgi:alpha-glucosidase (family GH31 glycosyl hydrolase)
MSFELRYPEMAIANGIDPSSNETVAFMISNKTFADSLQNLVLEPLAAEGLDFWWTDFQQGLPGVQLITGITPTMILNYYRFMNYTGSDRRGLIHSRYGGMGGHKFATGFGGDVAPSDWGTLPFMIYFTATAANTLFCWWGHEMMRNGPNPTDTIEPFVRYMQFGAWSPIYTNW